MLNAYTSTVSTYAYSLSLQGRVSKTDLRAETCYTGMPHILSSLSGKCLLAKQGSRIREWTIGKYCRKESLFFKTDLRTDRHYTGMPHILSSLSGKCLLANQGVNNWQILPKGKLIFQDWPKELTDITQACHTFSHHYQESVFWQIREWTIGKYCPRESLFFKTDLRADRQACCTAQSLFLAFVLGGTFEIVRCIYKNI